MRKSLYLLLLLSATTLTKGQSQALTNVVATKTDTVYLGEGDLKLKSKSQAIRYRITQNDVAVSNGKIQRTYYMSGKIFSELYFHSEPQKDNPKKTNNIKDGIYREWFENGNLKLQASYNNNKFNGEFITWWKNNQKRRVDNYTDGKCTGGTCYDSTGVAVAYYPYEQMPLFPGGEKELLYFIGHNLRYPVVAQENGVQGTVILRFVITKEGKVDNITILRSLSIETDREAYRVVAALPDWTPGKQEGEPVNVYYTLPIKYRLEGETTRQLLPFGRQNNSNF